MKKAKRQKVYMHDASDFSLRLVCDLAVVLWFMFVSSARGETAAGVSSLVLSLLSAV